MGKKRMPYLIGSIICFLLVSLAGSFPCLANAGQADGHVTVVDEAAVLMEEEADWLKSVALELAQKTDWNVIVATCQDADGNSAQKVCEKNFNQYTEGDDGISCLVDLDNREIYLATAGEAISYLDDKRINQILDEAYQAVADEDYAQCLYLMLLRAGEWYDLGTASVSGADNGLSLVKTIGGALGTLLVLFIVLVPVTSKRFRRRAAGRPGARRRRIYRNRTVNRSSAGRSRTTIHRGAGGRRFGGGGRKF